MANYQTDFWTPTQWQEFGSSGGTIGDSGQILYGSDMTSNALMPTQLGTTTDTGFGMDWMNTNAKGLGTIAGIGGLGLSAYDTFFGDTKKMNKKNMQLMDQQIAGNQQAMADRKTFNKNWADASNGLGRIS